MNYKIKYLFLVVIMNIIQGSWVMVLSQDAMDSLLYFNSSVSTSLDDTSLVNESDDPQFIDTAVLKSDTLSAINKSDLDCETILGEARELYNQGDLESIHDKLEPCLQSDIPYEMAVEAYKLIILSYLFGDNQTGAENTMLELLNKYPNFEPLQRDPVELNHYFGTFLVKSYLSIGAVIGTNISFPQIKTIYTTGNANDLDYSKSSKIGYQFGLKIGTNLTRKIGLTLEPMFVKNQYAFNETLFNNHQITFTQKQTRLDIPVTGTYELKRGRYEPYVRAGVCMGIMLSNTGTPMVDNQETEAIKITSGYKSVNFWMVAGAGVRYKLAKGFIMAELRYNYNLSNQVDGSNRYASDELWESYYYIDDDYLLHNLQINFGYTYSFYKARKNNNK
jgi:hypothetical protein